MSLLISSEVPALSGTTFDLIGAIKSDLDVFPFPKQVLPGLGLRRCVIPSGQYQVVQFSLDTETNLVLSATALTLQITTDELLRRLVWLLVV